MSQIETAVTLSRNLESLLAEKFHATGKGLHEKVSSVETALPADLVKQLRFIATMRNSVVHESNFHIPDLPAFVAAADTASQRLHAMPQVRADNVGAGSTPHTGRSLGAQLYLAAIAVGMLLGGAFGLQAGGLGQGVGTALGGGFIAMLAFSDDAIRFYKSVLETVLGLVIIGLVVGTVATVWSVASGTSKAQPAEAASKAPSPHAGKARASLHHGKSS